VVFSCHSFLSRSDSPDSSEEAKVVEARMSAKQYRPWPVYLWYFQLRLAEHR
jgi:hypothetical protein